MDNQWVCIYCKSPNPYNARYCSSCNARIPDLRQTFISGMKENEAESKDDEASNNEETFPMPVPGSMVGPLFELSDMVQINEISLQEFADRMNGSLERIGPAFESIYSDVERTGAEAQDYTDTIISLLENVHFMFEKGMEEMLFYTEDQDPSHLRFGRLLAQRAELEYIQILEMIRYDSSTNPFEGAPNVMGKLAGMYFDGNISLTEFKKEIQNLEENTMKIFEKSRQLLDEGFKIAGTFDGVSEGVLGNAIDKLVEAGDELSKAIVNLHTQEEIKGSVLQILEENASEETLNMLAGEGEN